jgi:type IV secretory pathway protease TraF
MRRFTTLIGALVLVVAACSGNASPTATPEPGTATPLAASPGPTTATPAAISAAVTFDGQACTYAGPAVIPRGAAVTFTLVNTPAWEKGSLGAALLVAPVRDGTTWEQVLAYAATQHVFPIPQWMLIPGTGVGAYGAEMDGLGEALPLVPDGKRIDQTGTAVMTRDLYVVLCNTHPDEGQSPFPAIMLTVAAAPAATPATPAQTATPAAISAAVTFDGQACTYAGPAVIPRGAAVTFTLVNTPAWEKGSLGAALLVAPVRDGTTWEQVLAYAATQHVFPIPQWMLIPGTGVGAYGAEMDGLGEALPLVPDGKRIDQTGTAVMTRDLYVVLCNTHPDEGQSPFPAIMLTVLDRG